MNLSKTFYCAVIFGVAHPALSQETKHSPELYWMNWLQIEYPAEFTMDPKSMQGEAKWWARFVSPDGSLEIETMSHGYCSDRLFHQEGFKTPEEYILKEVIPGSPLRTKHAGYDKLIRIDADSATVVFLKSDADWGKCYEQLRFKYPTGSYETHRPVIMAVINSSRPSFATPNSEQGGGGKPATRPESK